MGIKSTRFGSGGWQNWLFLAQVEKHAKNSYFYHEIKLSIFVFIFCLSRRNKTYTYMLLSPFSRFSRKRTYPHSPPLRSPEPVAKKVCSREVPPFHPALAASNGSKARASSKNGVRSSRSANYRNGNSAVTQAAATTTTTTTEVTSNEIQADMEEELEEESHDTTGRGAGRRSGRGRATTRTTSTSSRATAAADAADSSPTSSTSRSTRSSARLRSSKK